MTLVSVINKLLQAGVVAGAIGYVFAWAVTAHSEVIRPECQTPDSRALRTLADSLAKQAQDASPFSGLQNSSTFSGVLTPGAVTNGSMTMSGDQYEGAKIASEKLQNAYSDVIRRARELEAIRCSQYGIQILDNAPATPAEHHQVDTAFAAGMKTEWDEWYEVLKWQKDHPQCKTVEVWSISSSDGTSDASKDDFSGKDGKCSADGTKEFWPRGSEDDIHMRNPDQNPLIAQVECAEALTASGFGPRTYADPKLCDADIRQQ